jgi:hypothetical protein
MPQAFDATVVKIQVSHFYLGWKTICQHREAVIVRSDFHATLQQIFNRLIATTMAEDKLKSLAPKGAAQQLVTKTDSKSRHG